MGAAARRNPPCGKGGTAWRSYAGGIAKLGKPTPARYCFPTLQKSPGFLRGIFIVIALALKNG